MIPLSIIIILTLIIVGMGAYVFLWGAENVAFAKILICIMALFLCIFCSVNIGAGNVGDMQPVVTHTSQADADGGTTETEYTNGLFSIPVVDPALGWLYIGGALLFTGLMVYGLAGMFQRKREEAMY